MNSPRKRKPGGGLATAATQRPINRSRSFYLFKDQVEKVTPDFVRRAVDAALEEKEKIRTVFKFEGVVVHCNDGTYEIPEQESRPE